MNLATIAHEVKNAQDLCRQIQPLAARFSGFDIAAAYDVGRLIHEARVRAGASPVGRKIGFTNREIWQDYGIRDPIWGYVYDTTVVHLSESRGKCRLGGFVEPRIEPEIVLHFKSVPPVSADPASILTSIDWIAHGFEIVQSHYPSWQFQVADTVADSALHGTLLVGEPRSVEELGSDVVAQLERFSIFLSCDGAVCDTGLGSDVLGSPLAAVVYLIALIVKQPRAKALQAGELVTTGTLTAAQPVHAGEIWSTHLDGIALPGISVTFET